MNLEDLKKLLSEYGVKYHLWGTGESKTLQNLLDEINSGEATLVVSGNKLLWVTVCAGVLVTYREYTLIEDRQEFVRGDVRRRKSYGMSINEKLKPCENHATGAIRAIREELGIELTPIDILTYRGPQEIGPAPSQSYPGLLSRFTRYEYLWEMPQGFYKPEGYTEVQSDKTTYFLWKKLSDA